MASKTELLMEYDRLQKILDWRWKNDALSYYNNPEKSDRIHHVQVEFHRNSHRIRWLFGGNRTGKTVAGAVEAVWWARGSHPFRTTPRRATDGWVVSVTNEVQRDVAQKEILKWLRPEWIVDIGVRKGSKLDIDNAILDYITIESVWGGVSRIGFKSVEQGRAKFQGTSKDWIWFDEEPDKDIFEECHMRIIDVRGSIWGTMTPLQGLTWVYDRIYINEIGDQRIRYWVMEWADNPFLSPLEIRILEESMDEDERDARQYGKFVAMSGLIYKEFRESLHVIDPFIVPRDWYDKISIDPGYNNPLSCHWYATDYDGTVYVIAEHYERLKSVEYHARKIRQRSEQLGWPWMQGTRGKKYAQALMDSAANQTTLASEKSVADLFREHGVYPNTNVNKDVWSGIQRVKQYLKPRHHPDTERWPKGKPRLFIFRTCQMMIREIKTYRWAEAREGENDREKPKKLNDHAMDEMRYYLMTKPDPAARPSEPVKGHKTRDELEDMGWSKRRIDKYMARQTNMKPEGL